MRDLREMDANNWWGSCNETREAKNKLYKITRSGSIKKRNQAFKREWRRVIDRIEGTSCLPLVRGLSRTLEYCLIFPTPIIVFLLLRQLQSLLLRFYPPLSSHSLPPTKPRSFYLGCLFNEFWFSPWSNDKIYGIKFNFISNWIIVL